MALVAYDYSDNENDVSEDDESSQNLNQVKETEVNSLNNTNSLDKVRETDCPIEPEISDDEDNPMTQPDEDVVEEEYKMRIPASALRSSSNKRPLKNIKLPIKRKIERATHLLSIPTIDQFDSSDDDEEESNVAKRKSIQPGKDTKCGNGLLTLLPQPKSYHTNAMSMKKPTLMVPLTVSRPAKKSISTPAGSVAKPKMDILPSPLKNKDAADSVNDDSIEGSKTPQSFFSFYDQAEENLKICQAATVTTLKETQEDEKQESNSQQEAIPCQDREMNYELQSYSQPDAQDHLLQKVLESDRSIRRLKGHPLPTEFVDVNQADLTAGAQIELTKGITEESAHRSQRSLLSAQPANKMAGRKHQITWLAFKAKEREFELQNMWADNRQSKKQTQSKYGF